MPIPAFFYSDASFERGNDTPSEFVPAIKSNGYEQACLIDHNTTTSTIRFLDSAKSSDVGAIVGMTACVSCPERDHALWGLRNRANCLRLLEMIGVTGDAATHNALLTYDGLKRVDNAFTDNSLSSVAGKTRFVAECAEVIGASAERILDSEILQPFKKLLKHIDKALPHGELTFVAATETGYKNILTLNSGLGKHKSESIKQNADIPLALTIDDVERHMKDVFIVDGLDQNSYSAPFIEEGELLKSFAFYSLIGVYGLPLNASEKTSKFVASQAGKVIAPFPQFRYAHAQDYDAFCVKVAVQRKENVNSFLFDKPDKSSLLVSHDIVSDYYKSKINALPDHYDFGFWDSVGNTPVTLGEIHLPNYDMPIQQVVQFAFDVEDKEAPKFDSDDEAIKAFEALIEPERPEKLSVSAYRQRRLNDYCLLDLAYRGMDVRLEQNFADDAEQYREKYKKQVDLEFNVIKEMGFSGYFLIEFDFVDFARKDNIAVGPGRGSAAGSMLVYCIEVTDVDPILYDLKFERFLNPERVSMPDIDTDFGEGRERVLRYISEKYQQKGAEWPSSSQIANMNRYQLKSSISAVRGAYELSMMFDKELKDLIKEAENELGIVAPRNITWDELLGLDLVKKRMNREPMLSKVLLMAKKLTGKMQSYGVHAGGVVISPTIIPDYAAVWSDDEGNFFSLYDKDDIERAGLIKFDILGLRTLNINSECVSQIKENHGVDIDLRTIDYRDPAVYNLICQQTLCDVFQLNSQGMRQLVGNLQPQNIEELAVLSALFRPGALQSGMVEEYIDVKNGVKPPNYDHPALESVTSVTFGCIVFQEQVMGIVRELANYSLGKADILRRAMGKKKLAEMIKQRDVYAENALDYWRDHYLKIGKEQGFDFSLDVRFADCQDELEALGIAEFVSDGGYISGGAQFIKTMSTLLNMDEKSVAQLEGRVSDYNYVVKLFKQHYQSAIELSVQNTLNSSERAKEMYMRLYFALSQYVRFNQVFNKVEKFAGYGFNKSHAVAYAIVTYMSAWLKVYYPAEFYASAMTFKKKDELYETVVEASQKMGIKVAPPHVNMSRTRFKAETEKRVRYGLSKLASMGDSGDVIVEEREKNGNYLSIYDFCHRLSSYHAKPSSGGFASLAVSGGFDSFIPKRVQGDIKTNGREFNIWLRERITKSKALKEAEEPSSLHHLYDSMSKTEFAAYLTAISGVNYSKKMAFSVPVAMKKELREFFNSWVIDALELPRPKGAGKSRLSPLFKNKPADDFRTKVEAFVEEVSWKRPVSKPAITVRPVSVVAGLTFARQIDGLTFETPGLNSAASSQRLLDKIYYELGSEFEHAVFAGWVAKLNLTYKKLTEYGDEPIEPAINRIQKLVTHHPEVKIVSGLLQKANKTPFERHFIYILDAMLRAEEFAFPEQWWSHLVSELNQPVAETLNKERDACGFYLTSTPIKVLDIAQRVEREPPGQLIDGCPVKVGMIDGSHDGQSVTTYGVMRNVVVKTVSDEGSRNFGEKMIFFDLEDGAETLPCIIFGNKPTKALHEKIIKDGVVAMVCGNVRMKERGLSMNPLVIKRYHPVEDDKMHKVPKNF